MSYLREATGTLQSIIQTVKDFESTIAKSKNNRANTYLDRSSISRATKDLVASFPVLCDDSISSGTAAMITKACERNCLTMLQLLFSSAYLQGKSGREVLAQWHNNMDTDYGMDELLDVIRQFDESTDYNRIDVVQAIREFAPVYAEYMRDQRTYPESSFYENGIDSYEVDLTARGDLNVRLVTEKRNEDDDWFKSAQQIQNDIMNDKNDTDQQYKTSTAALNRSKYEADVKKFAMQHAYNVTSGNRDYRLNQDRFNYQISQDNLKRQIDQEREDQRRREFQQRAAMDASKQQLDYFTHQLVPSDVKKINELVPSMLVLQFDAVNGDGQPNQAYRVLKNAIIGVKARLIPCDSFEIIDHIRSAEKTKISLLNFFRATTNEISFARDFIGAVDQAKIEAKQNSRLSKTSPIWRTLQNRSNKSVVNRLRKNKANDASAITTLVISSEVSNVLKKDYNIDLNIPSRAKYIMEQYNLLCLVLVDEQTQVARFLYDGEKYFQDYSFDMLERETGDGSYKKIVNLLSTINR